MANDHIEDDALGLGDDFFAHKPPATADLVGKKVELTDDGAKTTYLFQSDTKLTRTGPETDGEAIIETYEAFKAGEGLYVFAFQWEDDPKTATEVVVDMDAGRALVVKQRVGPKTKGVPAVVQTVTRPELTSATGAAPFTPIAETDELQGFRVLWEYSETVVYEHIFLNDKHYVWHCLKGEEYPLADTDPCTVYKLRENVYALTFSEKELTMGAMMVFDYSIMRSYCAAMGDMMDGSPPAHFLFGAYGRVLSKTVYPETLLANDDDTKREAEVREAVQGYVTGVTTADTALLGKVFRDDAKMWGYLGPELLSGVPIAEFFKVVDEMSSDMRWVDTYSSKISHVSVDGNTAAATLTEHGYAGSGFVNKFTLIREGGEWKIATKTFTTVGEPAE